MGYKKDNLTVDCLAFTDDLAIIADSIAVATNQIDVLMEEASKAGLQISFAKTKFQSNIKPAPKRIRTTGGKIDLVHKFKYLGEWIDQDGSEKEAMVSKINKLEMAYHRTKNIYNKKCISMNAKIKHYKSVIRPETLYAAECQNYNRKGLREKLETKERSILRRIMGPVNEEGQYRRRHNEELYARVEKISDVIKKRRISFYAHIQRMMTSRITHKITTYMKKLKKPRKT